MSTFYRYEEDAEDVDHVRLLLSRFSLVKETPCGYWVDPMVGSYARKKVRWVSKTARKRYAYPTKAEALDALIARKRRQKAIIYWQNEIADATIAMAEQEKQKLGVTL
ncbi:MAG: hypothetical protein HGA87_00435 [Desulfobulbaceae bacterium]|nr:hypothetical protein [Desulfobulbaceae bacterium]